MNAAEKTVRDYLAAMEARDLAAARRFLAPGFKMEFPGPVRMSGLDELLAWAAPRYRFARKTYCRIDTCGNHAEAVVYCFGTLSGAWPDGSAFAGIRFIDRFTLQGGLLIDQTVWNDMGEVRSTVVDTPTA